MIGQNLLIIGPSWVGDTVMAQSLFKFLKWLMPSVTLDILIPPYLLSLISKMPEIRKAYLSPFGHGELKLKQRYIVAQELKKEKYHQAIILPNSFKSALIPMFAKIPIRTGWKGEMRFGLINDRRNLNKSSHPLMIQRFMALALKKNHTLPKNLHDFYPALIVDQISVQATLKKLNLTTEKPILVLCPGAEYGAAKRWPIEYFVEVAATKLREGWQVWLLGSIKDAAITQIILSASGSNCIDLAGKTTLGEVIDLLSAAQAVVTNDSGLMHVADALQLPVVALFGSTSTLFTPPLNKNAKVLEINLACRPCFQRECPLKHFQCMKDLSPKLVLNKLDEMLAA